MHQTKLNADNTQALAQEVGEIIGVDLSEKMVGAYNAKARLQVSLKSPLGGHIGILDDIRRRIQAVGC